MKYQFQFIGYPFSAEKPGTTCEFEEWDVAEMRRQTENWLELKPDEIVMDDKFFPKVKFKPAKARPAKG